MATINVNTGGVVYWVFVISFAVVMSLGGLLALGYCIHQIYIGCRNNDHAPSEDIPNGNASPTPTPPTDTINEYTHNPMMV